MANAKKCDRCGKLYERKVTYPFPQIKVVDEFSANNQRAYLDLNDLDLCFKCELSFFDWFGKELKDKNFKEKKYELKRKN